MSLPEVSAVNKEAQAAASTPSNENSERGNVIGSASLGHIRMRHVLILGGLTAFGPLSTDLYLPALPAVREDLNATMALTQLTLTACILGLALGQVLAGPLSDARGRRKPLLLGIAAFAMASLLCSIAPSVAVLAVVRFVQGLAGAAGVVIALAIARDLYEGETLARCISLLMTVNFLAPIAAPVLGGQLLRFASWRGVFVSLAIISVVFFAVTPWVLSETLPAERRQRGGIKVSLRAFRELLANRQFIGYALTCGFAFAAGIVYISVAPFVLQTIYGLSPQRFSLVFGINAVGLALTSQLGGWLIGRVAPRTLLAVGVAALCIAALSLLVVVLGGIGLYGLLPALFVLVASLGFIAPNATALALADTTAATAGSAAALLGVLQLSIGAIIAPVVGLSGTTALPMAIVITLFGIAAATMFMVFSGGKREAA